MKDKNIAFQKAEVFTFTPDFIRLYHKIAKDADEDTIKSQMKKFMQSSIIVKKNQEFFMVLVLMLQEYMTLRFYEGIEDDYIKENDYNKSELLLMKMISLILKKD